MNLDIRDVVVLEDNNEYVISSKIEYENKIYYYMVDMNNIKNFKFCYEDKDELVEITDEKKKTRLMLVFGGKILKDFNNVNES